jgi:hypothetical protein
MVQIRLTDSLTRSPPVKPALAAIFVDQPPRRNRPGAGNKGLRQNKPRFSAPGSRVAGLRGRRPAVLQHCVLAKMTVSSLCMSGVGARAGSDKPQKLLRFNSAQKLPFVRMRLECIQPPKPFRTAVVHQNGKVHGTAGVLVRVPAPILVESFIASPWPLGAFGNNRFADQRG